MPDCLFLDANILFSAAYNPTSPLLKLWDLSEVRLVTSEYALSEAQRNLMVHRPDRLDHLTRLSAGMEIVIVPAEIPLPPNADALPAKDRPILAAAIAAGATCLLTVDKKHFGPFLGQTIGRVRILTPGGYLKDI